MTSASYRQQQWERQVAQTNWEIDRMMASEESPEAAEFFSFIGPSYAKYEKSDYGPKLYTNPFIQKVMGNVLCPDMNREYALAKHLLTVYQDQLENTKSDAQYYFIRAKVRWAQSWCQDWARRMNEMPFPSVQQRREKARALNTQACERLRENRYGMEVSLAPPDGSGPTLAQQRHWLTSITGSN